MARQPQMVARRSPAAIGMATASGDARERLDVLRRDRILEEQQVVGLRAPGRARSRPSGVIHGGPCRSTMMSTSSPTASRMAAHLVQRIAHAAGLDRGDAAPLELQRHVRRGGMRHRCRTRSRTCPPSRFHTGVFERLALDVPQRHVDAAHGARADHAGDAVRHLGDHHLLPELLDVAPGPRRRECRPGHAPPSRSRAASREHSPTP